MDEEDPFEVSGLAGDSAFEDSVVIPVLAAAPVVPAKPLDRGSSAKLRSLDAASAVDCPVCGKANAPDYRFCRGCGSEADVGGSGGGGEAKKVAGRGRVSSSDAELPAAKRAVGRARPPPKPPGAETSAAASLALEERRAKRASASASSSAASASSAASFSSATVPTPKKNPFSDSGNTPTISPPPPAAASQTSPTSVSPSSAASFGSATVPTPKKSPAAESGSTVFSSATVPTPKGAAAASAASTPLTKSSELSVKAPSSASSSNRHTPGQDELLMSRTADESTRQFLLEVVRSHEEGIRDGDALSTSSTATVPTASELKKKPRAPTVKLKGTWSKASAAAAAKKGAGDVMSWSSLGLDMLAEQEGGTPQVIFQCSQYFLEKRCYNYPGLFKTLGSPFKVNQVMDAFADGSFQSFDAMEATPLDVLQCLKTFLLIVPEPPIPCSLFYELLDSCYEVSKEKQVQDVRNLLMRVSSACRAIARTVIDLCRKVLACQPSLQLTEIAQFVASALARPEVDQNGGSSADSEPQSYAIALALLELGESAFDAKATTTEKPVTILAAPSEELEAAKEETRVANEKVASLTRQLEEARKGQVILKKKLDIVVKENGELKRKLADSQKIIDSWKANAVMDMY